MQKRTVIGLCALTGIIGATVLTGTLLHRRRTPAIQTRAPTPAEQWGSAINRDGIRVSADLLNQYPLFERAARTRTLDEQSATLEEHALISIASRARAEFERSPLPRNYSEDAFYASFFSAKWNEQLVNPQATSKLVNLRAHPVYERLRVIPRHDPLTLLAAAIGITYETLTPVLRPGLPTREEFEASLKDGRANCTEYTYLAANLYYALCEDFAEDEHLDKIRIAFGCALQQDGNFGYWHNWLQLQNGTNWLNIEVSGADRIDGKYDGNTDVLALFLQNTVTAPLVTNRVTLTERRKILDLYTHLLPQR